MILHRLGPGDFRRMLWKNGGGETLQLAIWPPESDVETFDWRLTSASISSDGPFSTFAGIDRSLALLGGGRLQLTLRDPNQAQPACVVLQAGEQLAQFAGEIPIHSQRLEGELLTDFNVMTRRSRYRHQLQRLQLDGSLQVDHSLWMVYLTTGSLRAGELMLALAPGELLWAEGPATLRGQAEGWLVSLSAVTASPTTEPGPI